MVIEATSQNSMRALAVGGQRLAPAGQGVEGVAPLVQQGPHVAVEAHGVHEDERQAVVLERRLVAAGGLALAVGQVEQAVRAQVGELAPRAPGRPRERSPRSPRRACRRRRTA